MSRDEWTVTVITSGKIYRGQVYAGHLMDKRTIFLLNNSVKTTRDPAALYSLDGYLQLDQATVKAGRHSITADTIVVRKSDIVLVYDEFERMGTEQERKRYQALVATGKTATISILTRMRNRQCFRLTCEVINPKQKLTGREQFMALSHVHLERLGDPSQTRDAKPLQLPFVALNKKMIEAVYLADGKAPTTT